LRLVRGGQRPDQPERHLQALREEARLKAAAPRGLWRRVLKSSDSFRGCT
jgi:hypothetical protein